MNKVSFGLPQTPQDAASDPTAKLYRQDTPGDWGSVIARVKSDLRSLVQTAGS